MHQQRRTILVTDGEQRAALAAVRSLGAAGHTVYVCAHTPRSLAGGSRFASREFVVADALKDCERFAADVARIVRAHGADMVMPMSESALLALLPRREQFAGTLIPFPSAEAFAAISNKQTVLDAAARVGIAVPAQTALPTADAAAALDVGAIAYPVVVKPARSVSSGSSGRVKFSVSHAATPDELRGKLASLDARAYPILLQQRIVGPGIGVFLLAWDGEWIAQFSHRRIREQPPSGGISVYRESVALDERLAEQSRALLREFGWTGVAMVEYKVDAATGTAYLMEINGRFWGSLQLAIDAGVDFPRLLVEAATGARPAPVTEYRAGVRSRWVWGDLDHLIARLRFDAATLALPPGAPTRWQAIRAFLTRNDGDVNEILRTNDPRPFLRESIHWFRSLGGSA